jgi:hypothetical protein
MHDRCEASPTVTTSPPPAVTFRAATRADLPRVVELIADDAVAAAGTGTFGAAHVAGFEAIEASPNDELVVAELGLVQGRTRPTGLVRRQRCGGQPESVRRDPRTPRDLRVDRR